ncbi:MAG: phosphatase PAP2 family protein [Chloroflexi bacterium]|nr:phosphatase PAP2 family protein [Chloroflexota bacterium]
MTSEEKAKGKSWLTGLFRWRKGFNEVLIVGLVYGAYRLASGSIDAKKIVALENAHDVIHWERRMGLFHEPDFQAFFLRNKILLNIADTLYTLLYYPALVLFFFWAYNRHRKEYYIARNVFLVSAGIAFLCFAFYPVAPPRMLPIFGFVDTMKGYGVVNYDSPILRNLANPYAAMPSLHFAWTLLVGIGIFCIVKAWWGKVLGVFVPLGMFVAIVATANHFILDAVAGAVLLGLSYGVVMLFSALRHRVSFAELRAMLPKRARAASKSGEVQGLDG